MLWLSCADGWDRMVAKLLESVAVDLSRTIDWFRRIPAGVRLLPPPGGPESDSEDELLCATCGRWFSSLAGLRQHCAMVHQEGSAASRARQAVTGSVCPVCSDDYRSRIRVIRHMLHGTAACVAACKAGDVPVPDPCLVAEADRLDQASRARRRKLGLRDHDGPGFIAADVADV